MVGSTYIKIKNDLFHSFQKKEKDNNDSCFKYA